VYTSEFNIVEVNGMCESLDTLSPTNTKWKVRGPLINLSIYEVLEVPSALFAQDEPAFRDTMILTELIIH
jgi:hypothetical protein